MSTEKDRGVKQSRELRGEKEIICEGRGRIDKERGRKEEITKETYRRE
jgi:hypothetical protein